MKKNQKILLLVAVLLGYSTLYAQSDSDESGLSSYGSEELVTTDSFTNHEVSVTQYCNFLNTVASVSDPHELYNESMSISQVRENDIYYYFVKDDEGDSSITGVSLTSEMRYCNWIENGQLTGERGIASTEVGSYVMHQPEDPSPKKENKESDDGYLTQADWNGIIGVAVALAGGGLYWKCGDCFACGTRPNFDEECIPNRKITPPVPDPDESSRTTVAEGVASSAKLEQAKVNTSQQSAKAVGTGNVQNLQVGGDFNQSFGIAPASLSASKNAVKKAEETEVKARKKKTKVK